MGEGQQEVEQGDGPCLGDAVGDYLGIAVESSDEKRGGKIDGKAHQLSHDNGAEDAEPGSFFGAIILPGAQILADEGGQGHGKTGDGKKAEAFDFRIGSAACHGQSAEAVDIGLHHHIRDGNDGILKTGGKAVLNDLFQIKAVKTDFLRVKPVVLGTFQQLKQAEDGADELGNDGRKSGASHTHMESSYEQKIQNHVYHRRDDQVDQRVGAVAHGLKDADKNIIKHERDGTAEIDAEVGDGIGQHIFRRAHPYQQHGSEQKADYGEQHTGHQAECHCCVDGLLYLVDLSGTIISGNDDARADGNAVEKAHHQKNEASGGAYGRQGLASKKVSHDQRIRSIIKLLKEIPEKKRDGKSSKFFGDRPLGHESGLTLAFHKFLFPAASPAL